MRSWTPRAPPAGSTYRLKIDFGSHAMLERFGGDLERGRGVPEERTSEETGRVAIPSLELRGAAGESHWAVGTHVPGPRAPAELWRRAQDWRVGVRTVPGGEVWSLPA